MLRIKFVLMKDEKRRLTGLREINILSVCIKPPVGPK
jgi:hypothetical protein